MDAATFAKTKVAPHVHMRTIVNEITAVCRLFDGSDFVPVDDDEDENSSWTSISKPPPPSTLLGALLETESNPGSPARMKNANKIRKRSHRSSTKFFDCTLRGVKLRSDTFEEVRAHKLASCLDVNINDIHFSEKITTNRLKKMVGEWLNPKLHPRDVDDGMLMMKLISFHPTNKRTVEGGELLSDECRLAIKLLPLRCHIDQKVIHFVSDFFSEKKVEGEKKGEGEGEGDDEDKDKDKDKNKDKDKDTKDDEQLIEKANSFFQSANINSFKMMVDYEPVGINFPALRAGSYVELLNIFPLEELKLELDPLRLKNLTGWGSVFNEIFKSWIGNITTNQMHKFVTSAPPINTLNNIGEGMADLILLPMERYRKDRSRGSLVKGVREGIDSFGEKVGLEALSVGKSVTGAVSNAINDNIVGIRRGWVGGEVMGAKQPRNVTESFNSARKSVNRGFSTAKSTVFAIPEVYKSTRGDLKQTTKAAIRAVPIAVLAPLGGALEASSFTLLGIRNGIFPQKREEEENQFKTGFF